MNAPPFVQDEIDLTVQGARRKALLRTPRKLSQRSALLINLAVDRHATLDGEWFDIVPNVFLAAGHRVASLDMPFHGELAEPGGEGLVGMARAIARGENPFAGLTAAGTALINHCLKNGLADERLIVASGTSRGGLGALHLMAAEPRLLAVAIHAPLTDLATPHEFSEVRNHPMAALVAAVSLIDRLVDRPVFITIGTSDPRVGADHCFDFHARLQAASRITPPVLFVAEGESHGETCYPGAGYNAGAAFLLSQCAIQMKSRIGE